MQDIETGTPIWQSIFAVEFGHVTRFCLLTALFVAELLFLSLSFDTDALAGQHGLVAAVKNWGAPAVAAAITFAVTLSGFGWREAKIAVRSYAPLCRVGFVWLLTHAAAFCMFFMATRVVFGPERPSSHGNIVVTLWLLLGVAASAAAVLAFFAWNLVRAVLMLPRRVWAYSLASTGAACLALRLNGAVWKTSVGITFRTVKALLQLVISNPIADPGAGIIGSRNFQVTMAPECSGIEGIGLVLAFGTGWMLWRRREFRFPRALVLLPIAVVIMWALNALRITALILIGTAGAAAVALQGFHSQAGWIGFNAVAIGMLVSAERVAWLRSDVPLGRPARPNPAVPYLLPFLVILASSMVAHAASAGDLEWFYPLRVIAAGVVLIYLFPKYRTLAWRFDWSAVAIGTLVFALWSVLPGGPKNAVAAPAVLRSVPSWQSTGWVVFRVLGSVLSVPIAEELAFRGFLIRRVLSADFDALAPRTFTAFSVVLSSVAFGVMHGDRWLAGTLAGLLYAFSYLRSGGRIGNAVAAHATTNALIACTVLIFGRWELW